MSKQSSSNNLPHKFPPVVSVLGHVDHGKTTLLDAIRKTSIANREAGGITQKIGASSVEIIHEGKKRFITFIDTPGHEAFSKMRSRGAHVADLSLLVIAASEGFKPQTKESLDVLKKSKTPFIVVLTKIDMPNKNPAKVKQELAKEQVVLEEYGGETPLIEVSAKTNYNVKELLDLVLLFFDLLSEKEKNNGFSSNSPLEGVVIESKLDPKTGPMATVVIKNGTIRVRDEIKIENIEGKVRTIIDDKNQHLKEATIGAAIEILGLSQVPSVGSILYSKQNTLQVLENNQQVALKRELVYQPKTQELEGISVILTADTQGSLEAITHSLPEKVRVLTQKTGEISEADILFAKSTGSIVLGFNTKLRPEIVKIAIAEKVLVRNYSVIYEMLEEINDALEGKLQAQMEQILGRAKVLAKFPFEKTEAFGIQVIEGRIAKGDRARFMRGEEAVGETIISSLRVGKNPTSKVEKGHEAGIVITSKLDISVGDMIISHS